MLLTIFPSIQQYNTKLMNVKQSVLGWKRPIKARRLAASPFWGYARMGKNKPIDGSTLERICAALQCQAGEVLEYIPEE